MKTWLVLFLAMLQVISLAAQDSARESSRGRSTDKHVWINDIYNQNAVTVAEAEIVHFRNDSLVVPDSVFNKYRFIRWKNDTFGKVPGYAAFLIKGWDIPWPEQYNSGVFHIKIYRNYIVALCEHNVPVIPDEIMYIQPITARQFSRIQSLMKNGGLDSVLIKNESYYMKRHIISFKFKLDALGLYNYFDPVAKQYIQATKEQAEEQFYKGLVAFITAVNSSLPAKIPLPGPEYRHCYSHCVKLVD